MLLSEEYKELIRKTVHETLFQVGIEAEENEDVKEFRRDMEFLREFRVSTNQIKSKGLLVAVGLVAAGTLAAIWLGLKTMLGGS